MRTAPQGDASQKVVSTFLSAALVAGLAPTAAFAVSDESENLSTNETITNDIEGTAPDDGVSGEGNTDVAADDSLKFDAAQTVADDAKAASENADAAAEAALAGMQTAYDDMLAAQSTYEQARQDYLDAVAEQLKAGADLLSAENVKEAADAAAAEMEAAAETANAANEAAIAAAEEARALAESAPVEVQEQIDQLATVVEDQVKAVASAAVTTATAGAAYGVSQVLAAMAAETVNNYQAQLDQLNEQSAALAEEIAAAQKEVDAADAALKDVKATEAEYTNEIDAAYAELKDIREKLENADEILALKKTVLEQQTKLNNAEAGSTAEAEAVAELTKLLFDNAKDIDKVPSATVEAVENSEGKYIFSVTADDETTSYVEAQVETVDDQKVVKYYKATTSYATLTEAPAYPTKTGETPYVANQVALGVTVASYAVKVNSSYNYYVTYLNKDCEVQWNESGAYISYKASSFLPATTIYFTIEDRSNKVYTASSESEAYTSDSLATIWAAMSSLDDAQAKYDAAKADYDAVKDELFAKKQQLQAEYEALAEANDANIEAKAELDAQIEELNTKLNGSAAEQLLCQVLDADLYGQFENLVSDLKSASSLTDYLSIVKNYSNLLTELSIDYKDLLTDIDSYTELLEQYAELASTISKIQNGTVTTDEIKSAIEIITNSDLSAKTKLSICNAAVKLCKTYYEDSVAQLEDTAKSAETVIVDQVEAIEDALENVSTTELEAKLAELKQQVTAAAAESAEAAKQVAEIAKAEATELYEQFKEIYENSQADDTALINAKNAYDAAVKAYADAKAENERAQQAAADAAEALTQAIAAAKAAYEKPYAINVTDGAASLASFAPSYNGGESMSELEIGAIITEASMKTGVKVVAAAAEEGYEFDSWDVSGIELTDEQKSQAELTFEMPENAVTIAAKYKQVETPEVPENPGTDDSKKGNILESATVTVPKDGITDKKATVDTGLAAQGATAEDGRDYAYNLTIQAPVGTKVTVPVVKGENSDVIYYYVDVNGKLSPISKAIESDGNLVFEALSEETTICVRDVTALPFIDLNDDDWFVVDGSVNYAVAHDLIRGVLADDGWEYQGDGSLTRAMFATILYRLDGEPAVSTSATSDFADVADDAWYATAAAWAYEEGLMFGYGDTGVFGGDDILTREQMAVVFERYAKNSGIDTSERDDEALAKFVDADSLTFGKDAMSWCVAKGLIRGYESDNSDEFGALDQDAEIKTLGALKCCTRAESVLVLQRWTELLLS